MTSLEILQVIAVALVVLLLIYSRLRSQRLLTYRSLILDMSYSYRRHVGHEPNNILRILTYTTIAVVYVVPSTRHRDRTALLEHVSNLNFMRFKRAPEGLNTDVESAENIALLCKLYVLELEFANLIGEKCQRSHISLCDAADLMMAYVDFMRQERHAGRFNPWN